MLFMEMLPREVIFIKTILIVTVIIVSFFITGFDVAQVGGTTIGVVSVDIPVPMQKAVRTLVIKGAVNTVTLGGGVEYADENLTVVSGYSPLFRRISGLRCNIQAAARSTQDGLHIQIGVPALPPESY